MTTPERRRNRDRRKKTVSFVSRAVMTGATGFLGSLLYLFIIRH